MIGSRLAELPGWIREKPRLHTLSLLNDCPLPVFTARGMINTLFISYRNRERKDLIGAYPLRPRCNDRVRLSHTFNGTDFPINSCSKYIGVIPDTHSKPK